MLMSARILTTVFRLSRPCLLRRHRTTLAPRSKETFVAEQTVPTYDKKAIQNVLQNNDKKSTYNQ